MEFKPAINADDAESTDNELAKDPETFWEQLRVVTKLAVGPIISMIF